MASCVSLAGNQECIDDWFFGFGGRENLRTMEIHSETVAPQ
jgi:hypothetical protein